MYNRQKLTIQFFHRATSTGSRLAKLPSAVVPRFITTITTTSTPATQLSVFRLPSNQHDSAPTHPNPQHQTGGGNDRHQKKNTATFTRHDINQNRNRRHHPRPNENVASGEHDR